MKVLLPFEILGTIYPVHIIMSKKNWTCIIMASSNLHSKEALMASHEVIFKVLMIIIWPQSVFLPQDSNPYLWNTTLFAPQHVIKYLLSWESFTVVGEHEFLFVIPETGYHCAVLQPWRLLHCAWDWCYFYSQGGVSFSCCGEVYWCWQQSHWVTGTEQGKLWVLCERSVAGETVQSWGVRDAGRERLDPRVQGGDGTSSSAGYFPQSICFLYQHRNTVVQLNAVWCPPVLHHSVPQCRTVHCIVTDSHLCSTESCINAELRTVKWMTSISA